VGGGTGSASPTPLSEGNTVWVQVLWFDAWQSAWLRYDGMFQDAAAVSFDADSPDRLVSWDDVRVP
jgi:hypothetical protein